jgi:hypothetical protein
MTSYDDTATPAPGSTDITGSAVPAAAPARAAAVPASTIRSHAPRQAGTLRPAVRAGCLRRRLRRGHEGPQVPPIVEQALQILKNLDHRGACGCEVNTGDGAGMLLQMPHTFLKEVCKKASIALPEPGHYGCGSCSCRAAQAPPPHRGEAFASRSSSRRARFILGWRTVPTDNSMLGETAKAERAVHPQVFIGRGPDTARARLAFERKLYVIRKRAYSEIRATSTRTAPSTGTCQLSTGPRLQGHAAHRRSSTSTSRT